MRYQKTILALLITSLVYLDQLSKLWVSSHLKLYQSWALFSWLNLTLVTNKGIAFSMFSKAHVGTQIAITSITVGVLLFLGHQLFWQRKACLEKWPYCLLFAGACGNLIDRLSYGYVIDFIDVHWQQWHFATFNVADSMICLAVFWLLCFQTQQFSIRGNEGAT
jgi:signal peptidase II